MALAGPRFAFSIHHRRAERTRPGLSRAALLHVNLFDRDRAGLVHGNGLAEALEDLVGGVLEAGVGLVQLAGRLRCQLTELVAVVDVGQCSENKV